MDASMAREALDKLATIPQLNVLAGKARQPNLKVTLLEASWYMRNQLLRDADWASMAHSLEVRVPLVDASLLETLAPVAVSLAPGAGKRLLAGSPEKALPDAVIARAKTGFATPIDDWLQRDERLQRWQRLPQLTTPRCPWARRWAYQLAAA